MYKIVVIVGFSLVALGWIGYGIWNYLENKREKENPTPKPTTEHLNKVRQSFDDYMEKMKNFEKPKNPGQ